MQHKNSSLRVRSHRRRGALAAAISATVIQLAAAGCSSDDHDYADTDDVTAVDIAAAPADVTWKSYQGVQVPYSSIDGPADDVTSVAPTGYSQTPQGAVIAAIQAQARLALAPDSTWAHTTSTLVVAGPGRDAYAVARAGASITAPADPATTARFTAFRITDYQPEHARIELATEMPGGQRTSVPVTVLWRSDDWKLALPDTTTDDDTWDAPAASDPVVLTSLDGFTDFAA